MMLFGKRLNSMVAAVFGLALCAHGAQAPQAPQHVNINQLTTTVEDVVVPLPIGFLYSGIFATPPSEVWPPTIG